MINANNVAEYFLFKAYQDDDPITNLKLQKLLYYAQGFYLAFFDKPLFNESIQNWTHGPVVPDVYHIYKDFEGNPLPPIEEFDTEKYDPNIIELLNEVYSVYGQFSASALRNMTHQEPPWKETPSGATIDLKLLKEFFKTRIENGENKAETS